MERSRRQSDCRRATAVPSVARRSSTAGHAGIRVTRELGCCRRPRPLRQTRGRTVPPPGLQGKRQARPDPPEGTCARPAPSLLRPPNAQAPYWPRWSLRARAAAPWRIGWRSCRTRWTRWGGRCPLLFPTSVVLLAGGEGRLVLGHGPSCPRGRRPGPAVACARGCDPLPAVPRSQPRGLAAPGEGGVATGVRAHLAPGGPLRGVRWDAK